jgi:hypothetical protein
MSSSSVVEKLREPRIGGIAVFDVAGTALGGYAIAYKMGWSKPKTIVGMFLLGHGVHYVLRIETQLNKPKS